MKLVGRSVGEVHAASAANKVKRYVTNNEELGIIQMYQILSMCSCGVSVDELLNMTYAYIHQHPDATRLIQAATGKTTHGMMGHHKELFKIVQASLVVPNKLNKLQKIQQMLCFSKLDAYIKWLDEMQHVSWKAYKDTLEEDPFNMDKVGMSLT
jgi:hypothetical protein